MKRPLGSLLFLNMALLLSACQRAPQTADELRQRLPHKFIGEVRWQGETQGQLIRLEPRDLTARAEHLLEFNGVNVELLDAQHGVTSERVIMTRGTISAPGLEIRIEDLGSPSSGEDMLKPGSFQGKISENLKSVEASWTSGFGGKGALKLTAEP